MNELEIFEKALAIPNERERDAYLAEACAGDTNLRKDVESLFESARHANSFMQQNAAESFDATTINHSTRIGQTIGRYKLLEQIGEGGFGYVFMAEQVRPVTRKVALKIIKPGMDTKQVVARFEAERQALALMDHPNIGKILDAGATEAGQPYFVMELVRGIPITEYCTQRKLSTRQRLDLFMEVCGAIEHAHQKGIIHRDIKPKNILVYNNGERAVPKVIDFGIAKATQGRLTDKTLFTQFHQFIGTPAYMSPEQAQMSGVDVDTRSDIYSLGVVLYELLTGKTPLEMTEIAIQALDEACRRIREENAPRPSVRISSLTQDELSSLADSQRATITEITTCLRGDLDWIVMKALEKDRDRRYRSTDAFSADIRRHLHDEPVSAGPPDVVYRIRKLLRRHRTAASAALAIALTLVVAVIISSVGWRGSAVARRNSDAAMKKANEESWRATEIAYLADMRVGHEALDQDKLGLGRRILAQNSNFSPDHDPRHWEWQALHLRCEGNAERKFGMLDGSIIGLSVHPDGNLIAAGGPQLRVWDVKSGLPVHEFPMPGIGRFDPGGNVLYTTDPSGLVRGWRLPGFEATDFIISHGSEFSHSREMQISPDGKLLATFGDDREVALWNTGTGKEIIRFPTKSQYRKLVFSPDGTKLFVTGHPCNFTVELPSMEVEDAFDESGKPIVGGVAFSPDGEHLARNMGRSVSIQRLSDGEQLVESEDHGQSIMSIAYSADGRLLASAGNSRSILVHEWASNRLVTKLSEHELAVAEVAFLPDGRLVSGGRDGKICVWNLNNAIKHAWPRSVSEAYNWKGWKYWPAISCSHDGTTIASTNLQAKVGSPAGTKVRPGITLRSANDLREIGRLAESSGAVGAVVYSPVEDLLVLTNESGALEFITYDQDHANAIVDDPDGTIIPLQFTPDGERLLAVVKAIEPNQHYHGTVIPTIRMLVYRVADRQQLASWTIPHESSAAISPDGKVVATGHDDGLRFWSVGSPEESTHVAVGGFKEGNAGLIWCLDFSPDGRHVIAGTNVLGHVEIVDAETKKPVGRLLGHTSLVGAVSFSSDGRRVASGGGTFDTVKIWDFATRREIMTLKVPGAWSTRHLEWLPGDDAIMVGTGDSILALFRTPRIKNRGTDSI